MTSIEYQVQFLVEGDGKELDHRSIAYVKGAINKALANGKDIRWIVTTANEEGEVIGMELSPTIPSEELRKKAWK